jgi:energy-coupling factor transport system ATP-binding protein
MSNLFELIDGSVAFQTPGGNIPAFNHVSLNIQKGEWLAVVGPNGSGKSTLARVMAGLCEVSRGQITRSFTPSLGLKSGRIQIVFQNPDAQIVGQTVFEDVCFGLENHAVATADISSRVHHALDLVGLSKYIHAEVDALSGGQKQLLCIASALALEPSAIIFDEATSMLDPLARDHILQIVKELHQRGTTIIWMTQWMDELSHATRVVALRDGTLFFEGDTREFFYGKSANDAELLPSVCGASQTTVSACETLGFPRPYVVQVALELQRLGASLPLLPISPEELSQVVRQS